MNKIKSLLRNFKARITLRIVSFCTTPYKYLADKIYDHIQEDMPNILENTSDWRELSEKVETSSNLEQSLWDTIHDQAINLVEDKLDSVSQSLEKADLAHKLRGEFITSADIEDELNDSDTISALECDITRLQDGKVDGDDFDYELSQAYSFTELSDKVDELEANSDGDPFTDIDDESHPVSKLIDDRNEQIHSLIIELKDRLDIAEQNLAVKTEQMETVYTKLKELKNFDTVLSAIKDLEAKLPTNG